MSLLVGILSPMLEVSAYKDDLTLPLQIDIPFTERVLDLSKTFEGRMYFYYQNKSVVDLIAVLFEKKNYVVAVSILSFSILIPIIKLFMSLSMIFMDRSREILGKIVSTIGKWSMADVFVVANFLAYLSFQNMQSGTVNTDSHTLIGLYFFLAYCVLSLMATHFINMALALPKVS
jgi:uncharacterized paraquat-inducible protein A